MHCCYCPSCDCDRTRKIVEMFLVPGHFCITAVLGDKKQKGQNATQLGSDSKENSGGSLCNSGCGKP